MEHENESERYLRVLLTSLEQQPFKISGLRAIGTPFVSRNRFPRQIPQQRTKSDSSRIPPGRPDRGHAKAGADVGSTSGWNDPPACSGQNLARGETCRVLDASNVKKIPVTSRLERRSIR